MIYRIIKVHYLCYQLIPHILENKYVGDFSSVVIALDVVKRKFYIICLCLCIFSVYIYFFEVYMISIKLSKIVI